MSLGLLEVSRKRAKGLEPSTYALGTRCSTTELRPQWGQYIPGCRGGVGAGRSGEEGCLGCTSKQADPAWRHATARFCARVGRSKFALGVGGCEEAVGAAADHGLDGSDGEAFQVGDLAAREAAGAGEEEDGALACGEAVERCAGFHEEFLAFHRDQRVGVRGDFGAVQIGCGLVSALGAEGVQRDGACDQGDPVGGP